jgi:hypothetical protein
VKVNDRLKEHQSVKDVKHHTRCNSDCGSQRHEDLFENTILSGRVEAML